MSSITPWLGVIVLVLTGWAIVKKYQVNMVLFIGGLLLNILALMGGMDALLNMNPFDILAYQYYICCVP